MAEKIKTETGFSPKLVPGSGGVFDVEVGSTTIFSKHTEGRYPDENEIVEKLEKL